MTEISAHSENARLLFRTFVLIISAHQNFESQSQITAQRRKLGCWHLRLALIRGQQSFSFFCLFVFDSLDTLAPAADPVLC